MLVKREKWIMKVVKGQAAINDADRWERKDPQWHSLTKTTDFCVIFNKVKQLRQEWPLLQLQPLPDYPPSVRPGFGTKALRLFGVKNNKNIKKTAVPLVYFSASKNDIFLSLVVFNHHMRPF